MLRENPYRATLHSEPADPGARSRAVAVLWWLVYLYPAISLALIYACWMLTTVSLGRPPEFGEHPDHDVVHGLMHSLAIPAALLALAGPVLIPVGLVWGFRQPFAQRLPNSVVRNRLACLASYLLALVAVGSVYAADPLGAAYWFWD